ncbi:MAG: galactose oxidase [Gammaproteobacteria bacterium]|nr:galactose oxidase [Gammaproteobacteria bacterium]
MGGGGGLLAAIVLPRTATAGTWQDRPSLPYRVQEIYPAWHRGRIYVAGGLSPDVDAALQNISTRVIVYDPESSAWSDAPSLPEPRHHAYLVANADELFLFGGFVAADGGRWSASRDVLRLTAEGWRVVDAMPEPQSETVAIAWQGRIHLAGGRQPLGQRNADWEDQGDTGLHQVFDPGSGQWQPAAPLPTPRNSAAGVLLDGRWHVVGGRTVRGGNLAVHEAFDFATDSWSELAPLPQAAGGIAAAALDGRMYVFGGEYFGATSGVYAEVWEYEPQRDAWNLADEMPVPRHGLGALATDEAIYVIGGAAQAGGSETTDRLVAFRP